MTLNLKDLAEYNIRKAQAEGVFDNLQGMGKPLDGDIQHFSVVSDVTALGDVVPHMCKLKKEIEKLELNYQIASLSWDDKREVDKKIKYLRSLLEIEEEATHAYFRD